MKPFVRERTAFSALLLTAAITAAAAAPIPIAERPAVENQGYLGLGFTYHARNEKEGNFIIINVAEGGPAQAAGIRKGDVIETIDGLTCSVSNWDREPINPFKWVVAGDLLRLTIRRGSTILPLEIKTTARPYPMGDTEALMRAKAKSMLGDHVFDRLATQGAEVKATRSMDGELNLQCAGVSSADLEDLANSLNGRLGSDLGFRLAPGSSATLRLGLHPQKGFPSLLEIVPLPTPGQPAAHSQK